MDKSITSYVKGFADVELGHYIHPFDFAPQNLPTYEVKSKEFRFPVPCKITGYHSSELKGVEDIYEMMIQED